MAQHTHRLMPFGLRANERSVLSSLCSLSHHSSREDAYALTEDPTLADIYVVDADDAEAMQQWRAANSARRRPVVFVGSPPAGEAAAAVLRRPLLASRVMATMDGIARVARTLDGVGGPSPQAIGRVRPGTLGARPGTLGPRPATVEPRPSTMPPRVVATAEKGPNTRPSPAAAGTAVPAGGAATAADTR